MRQRAALTKLMQSLVMGALFLLSIPVSADALSIDFAPAARDTGAISAQVFVLQNRSGGMLQEVRIDTSSTEALKCSTAGDALPKSNQIQQLSDGQQIQCRLHRPMQAGKTAVVITSRDVQGHVQMQRFSMFSMRGAGPLDQGVVVLTSAGVHQDTNSNGVLEAGERIDYSYRLINLGTLALSNLGVTDLDGAVACPATTLAAGAELACMQSHVITTAEETAGRVDNLVEVIGQDALGLPVQSSDLIVRLNLAGRAGIAIIKSPFLLNDADGSGFASLGDRVRYDFIVRNSNDETLSNVELIEPDPDLIDTPIVCDTQTLDGNPFAGNGTGTLEPGDVVLCTAEYEIRQRDVDAGQALNLAEVLADTPLNLPVQATGASTLVVPGAGQLRVEKITTTPIAQPGGSVEFEISVMNVGTIPLFDVLIEDPIPVGIQSFDWNCTGLFCANAIGSGAINETLPSLPAGEGVLYTIQATLDSVVSGEVINTVTVQPSGPVVCQPDFNLSPCSDDASVLGLETMAVPALGKTGLALLILLMLIVALVRGLNRTM